LFKRYIACVLLKKSPPYIKVSYQNINENIGGKGGEFVIYTVGHSTRPLASFIKILKNYGIGILADIRRFPHSLKFPHFNRESLSRNLMAQNIDYIHIENLGGRRGNGFKGYINYMNSSDFAEGVNKLLKVASSGKTAIMCAEKLPWKCHRFLVATFLLKIGIQVVHIIDEKNFYYHKYANIGEFELGVEDPSGPLSMYF